MATTPASDSAQTSSSVEVASDGPRSPRRARPPAARRGRVRAGSRGSADPSPRSFAATRIARDWSSSNAPRSQNTSAHLRERRARVEHRAAHVDRRSRRDRAPNRSARRAPPRNVVSSVSSRPSVSRRCSPSTLQRVPRFDLEMRGAGPQGLVARGGVRSHGARRRSPRTSPRPWIWIPPAAYFPPRIRASNSAVRSPANTRCVWLSTNPGITAPAGRRRSADPRRLRARRRWIADPGDAIAVDRPRRHRARCRASRPRMRRS